MCYLPLDVIMFAYGKYEFGNTTTLRILCINIFVKTVPNPSCHRCQTIKHILEKHLQQSLSSNNSFTKLIMWLELSTYI